MSSNDYHMAQQGINNGTYANQVELDIARQQEESRQDIEKRGGDKQRQRALAQRQKSANKNAKAVAGSSQGQASLRDGLPANLWFFIAAFGSLFGWLAFLPPAPEWWVHGIVFVVAGLIGRVMHEVLNRLLFVAICLVGGAVALGVVLLILGQV